MTGARSGPGLNHFEPVTIYFVQPAEGGPIKIGCARSVERRLKEIQSCSPYPLTVLHTMPGMKYLEEQIHERLAEHRLHSEWFADVPQVWAEMKAEAAT